MPATLLFSRLAAGVALSVIGDASVRPAAAPPAAPPSIGQSPIGLSPAGHAANHAARLRRPTEGALELREAVVRGIARATIIDIPLPSVGAQRVSVRDSVDASLPAIVLDLKGASSAGRVERAVGAGGVVSVTALPLQGLGVRLVVRLTDLRGYALTTLDDGTVRLTLDGTGEEFAPRTLSLVSERVLTLGAPAARATGDTAAETGDGRTRGGRVLRDEQIVTADDRTAQMFRTWGQSAKVVPTMTWTSTALRDALGAIAAFSGRSIVPGLGTDTVTVSGDFRGLRWTDVLTTVAQVNGLRLRVTDGNVITVEASGVASRLNSQQEMVSRVYQLSYQKADSVASTLEKHVPKEQGTVTALPARSAILVTGTPAVLERVGQLMPILDAPVRQVRISATIYEASSDVAQDLSVAYDVASKNAARSLGGIPALATTSSTGSTGGTSTSTGSLFDAARRTGGAAALPIPGVQSAAVKLLLSTLQGGYRFSSLIEAAETRKVLNVVARQTGFVKDGQKFEGNSGKQTPLRSVGFSGGINGVGNTGQGGAPNTGNMGGMGAGGQAGSNGQGGIPFASVGLVETGIRLTVTPHVEPDGWVSLEVEVEKSNSQPSAIGDAGVEFVRNTYRSNVRAHDGETVIVGTLQDQTQGTEETGVPGLMRIPLLGNLFKSSAKTHNQRQLLILVTAKLED